MKYRDQCPPTGLLRCSVTNLATQQEAAGKVGAKVCWSALQRICAPRAVLHHYQPFGASSAYQHIQKSLHICLCRQDLPGFVSAFVSGETGMTRQTGISALLLGSKRMHCEMVHKPSCASGRVADHCHLAASCSCGQAAVKIRVSCKVEGLAKQQPGLADI